MKKVVSKHPAYNAHMNKTIYATEDQNERWETALRLMQDELDDRHLSISAMLHECVRRYVESRTEPVDGGDG